MHHQVRVGNAFVNGLNAIDGQDVARRLAREFVGAVAGANGNGQSVQLRALHKIGGLFGVCEQLLAGHHGVCAVAVFLVTLHGFQRTQAAQFTFHRDAQFVRHADHFLRHFQVVFVAGNGFAVGFQAAVHHDRAKAQVDGALADGRALAVVLVHHHGNFWIGLNRGLNQQLQEAFARIFARTRRGLHDHGRAGFFGGFHDGLNLLQIVDVEGWNTVAIGRGVVQQLAH